MNTLDLQYRRALLTYIVGINYLMITQGSEVVSANYTLSVSECEFVLLLTMLWLVKDLNASKHTHYCALLSYCIIRAI